MPLTATAALLSLCMLGQNPLDRVDLVSEDPGTWVNYDLPVVGANSTATVLRFVEQLKLVWRTPVERLFVGTSIASQSLVYEHPLLEKSLFLSAGLQTKLLLPRGITAGLAWRAGYVRLGAGVSVLSSASWSNLNWTRWSVLPTVGVGIAFAPP